MKIEGGSLSDSRLSELGQELASLLQEKQFERIGQLFGYALAFGDTPQRAIETDLNRVLTSAVKLPTQRDANVEINISYFEENENRISHVVECRVPFMDEGVTVLAELVVTESNGDSFCTLEQLS